MVSKKFRCRLCSAVVHSGVDYKRHWYTKHKNISGSLMYKVPRRCFSCREYFKNDVALVQHLSCHHSKCFRRIPNNSVQHLCEDCNKTFANDVCLQMHFQYSKCQSKVTAPSKVVENDDALEGKPSPVTATFTANSMEVLSFNVKTVERNFFDNSSSNERADDGDSYTFEGVSETHSNPICSIAEQSNFCWPKSENIIEERNLFDAFCVKNEACNALEQLDVAKSSKSDPNDFTSCSELLKNVADLATLSDPNASEYEYCSISQKVFENGYVTDVPHETSTQIADKMKEASNNLEVTGNMDATAVHTNQPQCTTSQGKKRSQPVLIVCRICRKNFHKIKHYHSHFKTFHPQYATDEMFDDGWKCSLCSSVHKKAGGLRMHWRKTHPDLYDEKLFTEFIKNEMNN